MKRKKIPARTWPGLRDKSVWARVATREVRAALKAKKSRKTLAPQ